MKILMSAIRIKNVNDEMIADMINNKKNRDSITTELLIRSRKLSIFLVFITQSSFVVPKKTR